MVMYTLGLSILYNNISFLFGEFMKILNFFKMLLLGLILAFTASFSGATAASNTNVQDAEKLVLSLMDETYAKLEENDKNIFTYFSKVAEEKFALTYMTRWSLGQYYKSTSDELRKQYYKAAKEYLVRNYGTLFVQYYKLYKYKIKDSVAQGQNEVLVNMLIEAKDSGNVPNNNALINVQWKLRYSNQDKKYYITDVIINNISFLNSQRSVFQSLIKSKNNDIAAFITTLEEKVANIKNKNQ
ncbi:ABC transporter substrate-binding protein [Candidatus Hepatincolaceae symbiont of Richtersius coronifer]